MAEIKDSKKRITTYVSLLKEINLLQKMRVTKAVFQQFQALVTRGKSPATIETLSRLFFKIDMRKKRRRNYKPNTLQEGYFALPWSLLKNLWINTLKRYKNTQLLEDPIHIHFCFSLSFSCPECRSRKVLLVF